MALFGRSNTADAKIRVGYDGKAAKRGLDQLKKTVDNVKKGVGDFAKKFGPAALAIGGMTLAVRSLGQAMEFVSRVSREFERSMSKVRAITGANAKEFKELSDRAKELGETTVFTASQAADAFTEMAKLGLEANEIIEASAGVLDLAAVAQTDMATASMAVVSTLNQFQLTADSANGVVDVMAKSFTASALDMTKFTEAMKLIGPIAANTGTEIQEVTGAIAVLADNSIDASLAGTAMRKIMLELANENSKASKAIKETGKKATTFTEKMAILAERGLDATEATRLFGLRATTAAQVIAANIDKFEDLTEEFKNAGGASAEMAEIMLDNVHGATMLLTSAQEALGIAIGEAFADSKKERILLYAETIREATKVVKEHQKELRFAGEVITETISGILRFGRAVLNVIQINFKIIPTIVTGAVAVALKGIGKLLDVSEKVLTELNDRFDKLVPDVAIDALQAANEQVEKFDKIATDFTVKTSKSMLEDLKQIGRSMANIKEESKAANEEIGKITKKPGKPAVTGEIAPGEMSEKELKELRKAQANALKGIRDEMDADAEARWKKRREMQAAMDKIEDEALEREDERMKRREQLQLDFASAFGNTLVMIGKASKATAEEQKVLATIQAIINTSVAITKTIALLGYPEGIPFVALAAAQGAAQIAMIQSQKFQQGGLVGEQTIRGRQRDTIHAMLGNGEFVVPAPQTAQNIEILESIRNNTANTAAGMRGTRGSITNNFIGLNTEQVINIQRENERRSITGTLI